MRAPGERSRFLFVHVMKTGGTSLVMHMLKQFAADEVYPNGLLDRSHPSDFEPYASLAGIASVGSERRATIRVYAGHVPFMAKDVIGGDVQTFTLLRDPVDRTVSVLRHFKRLYERYREAGLDEIYEDAVLFRHFVHEHQTRVFSVTAEDRPDAFSSPLTFAEIRDYVEGHGSGHTATTAAIAMDAHRLARAKVNLASVDVVGINERSHDFIMDLQRRFGWWTSGIDDEQRANVSLEDWQASASLRKRIADDNVLDLELYEYARELVESRAGGRE